MSKQYKSPFYKSAVLSCVWLFLLLIACNSDKAKDIAYSYTITNNTEMPEPSPLPSVKEAPGFVPAGNAFKIHSDIDAPSLYRTLDDALTDLHVSAIQKKNLAEEIVKKYLNNKLFENGKAVATVSRLFSEGEQSDTTEINKFDIVIQLGFDSIPEPVDCDTTVKQKENPGTNCKGLCGSLQFKIDVSYTHTTMTDGKPIENNLSTVTRYSQPRIAKDINGEPAIHVMIR